VKPYSWKIVPVPGEAMPRNLTLDPVSGHWRLPGDRHHGEDVPHHHRGEGLAGTSSQRKFNLRVVAPGAIVFTNLSIPDGLVGTSYLTDIGVKNFDGSPLAKPLNLPRRRGARAEASDGGRADVLLLQGTPKVAGTYAFTIEVEDNKGRNDAADFLMRVYPGAARQRERLPSQLRQRAEKAGI